MNKKFLKEIVRHYIEEREEKKRILVDKYESELALIDAQIREATKTLEEL